MGKQYNVLENIGTKLRTNLANMKAQQAQVKSANENLEPEVRAAAELLMKKYEHPEGAMAVLKGIGTEKAVNDIIEELEIMVPVIDQAKSWASDGE